MAKIDQLSLIDSHNSKSRAVESGIERVICDHDVCGSSILTAYRRTVAQGRQFEVQAADEYHLLYVVQTPSKGSVYYGDQSYQAEQGAGVLLAPGERAKFAAASGDLELLHLVVPKPPAAIEAGLAGGPGYFFNHSTLRVLNDASGGRVRRFCAESSIRHRNGERLTQTNAIQAGEIHYNEGGGSPYHVHVGTTANPEGAEHCYITFAGSGRGLIEVSREVRDVAPDTLVYIPAGIPHRFRSQGGPLDYFEVQAWRSFKTTILSEEPLGLKWYYERQSPNEALVEWNQS